MMNDDVYTTLCSLGFNSFRETRKKCELGSYLVLYFISILFRKRGNDDDSFIFWNIIIYNVLPSRDN